MFTGLRTFRADERVGLVLGCAGPSTQGVRVHAAPSWVPSSVLPAACEYKSDIGCLVTEDSNALSRSDAVSTQDQLAGRRHPFRGRLSLRSFGSIAKRYGCEFICQMKSRSARIPHPIKYSIYERRRRLRLSAVSTAAILGS